MTNVNTVKIAFLVQKGQIEFPIIPIKGITLTPSSLYRSQMRICGFFLFPSGCGYQIFSHHQSFRQSQTYFSIVIRNLQTETRSTFLIVSVSLECGKHLSTELRC